MTGPTGPLADAEEIGAELVKLEAALDQFITAWRDKHLREDRYSVYAQPLFAQLSTRREVLRGRLILINKRLS